MGLCEWFVSKKTVMWATLLRNATIILISSLAFQKNPMSDQKYSWKGSPNAGLVLAILAGIGAILLLLTGLNG